MQLVFNPKIQSSAFIACLTRDGSPEFKRLGADLVAVYVTIAKHNQLIQLVK